MFFLIRCIFWLGLVFSALPWNGEEVRADVATGVQNASVALTNKVQSVCQRDPASCLQHAAQATKVMSAATSLNTLTRGDLAPAWKGSVPRPASRPST
ncbi:MAG: hypothetical protein JWL62_1499 [Hyphomicrobiales bacterium]|jgi:hypothetical protein|nr:hypothetical protein [Hyphomicrobiales bacterium]